MIMARMEPPPPLSSTYRVPRVSRFSRPGYYLVLARRAHTIPPFGLE